MNTPQQQTIDPEILEGLIDEVLGNIAVQGTAVVNSANRLIAQRFQDNPIQFGQSLTLLQKKVEMIGAYLGNLHTSLDQWKAALRERRQLDGEAMQKLFTDLQEAQNVALPGPATAALKS